MSQKKQNDWEVPLGIIAWIIGSAAVGGFLRSFGNGTLVNILAVIFVIGWGIVIIWFIRKLH